VVLGDLPGQVVDAFWRAFRVEHEPTAAPVRRKRAR
jgi:hypothetical protein